MRWSRFLDMSSCPLQLFPFPFSPHLFSLFIFFIFFILYFTIQWGGCLFPLNLNLYLCLYNRFSFVLIFLFCLNLHIGLYLMVVLNVQLARCFVLQKKNQRIAAFHLTLISLSSEDGQKAIQFKLSDYGCLFILVIYRSSR